MPLVELRSGRAFKERQAMKVCERIGNFVVMPVDFPYPVHRPNPLFPVYCDPARPDEGDHDDHSGRRRMLTDAGKITLDSVSPDSRFCGVSAALPNALKRRARKRGNERVTRNNT